MAKKPKKKRMSRMDRLRKSLREHPEQARRFVDEPGDYEISDKPFGPLPPWLRDMMDVVEGKKKATRASRFVGPVFIQAPHPKPTAKKKATAKSAKPVKRPKKKGKA